MFAQHRTPSTKQKDRLRNGRRHSPITHQRRGSYPKCIKNSFNSTPKISNNPIKKWTQDLIGQVSEEDVQMADRHEKMLDDTNHQRNAN